MPLFETVSSTAVGAPLPNAPVRRIRHRSEFDAAKWAYNEDSRVAAQFAGAVEVDGGTVIAWTPFLTGAFPVHILVREVPETEAEYAAKLRVALHELSHAQIEMF